MIIAVSEYVNRIMKEKNWPLLFNLYIAECYWLLFYFSYSIEHSNLSFQLCVCRLLASDKEKLDWATESGHHNENLSARKRKFHDKVFCVFMPCCFCARHCFSEMLIQYTCAKLRGVTSQNRVHRIIINVKTEGFWDIMLCNWQQLLMFRRRLILHLQCSHTHTRKKEH
jgi:hypothetical protein